MRVAVRLAKDLPFFAKKALSIRTKSGKTAPFELNKAQLYIHKRLEAQSQQTGRVRALILKGRQQGCSTYVGGRFYQKTITRRGVRTYILTHEQEATNNLFDMARRYQEHCYLAPQVERSNAKELIFRDLDSGYKVGTAGAKGVGRSSTIQLFHGSEVAFWPHASEHAAGALQAVPKAKGTEVILESTANGIGNFFHKQWQLAERGQSDFQAIFVPWFWQDEYRLTPPPDFSLTDSEIEYQQAYDLSLEQICWRRAKIAELGDDILFIQEYPANATEAFQTTGTKSFITSETVIRARKNTDRRSYGAVVAGFDPKRDGDDKDAFVYRQGGNAWGLTYHDFKTFPEKVRFCSNILHDKQTYVDMLFVDHGGGGWEIAGALREMGLGDRVTVVNFGASASQPQRYPNKRSEMWGEMRDWLADENEPASIPDDDALHGDLTAPGYHYDNKSRPLLERKAQIKSRLQFSPDGADALALTFAKPIIRDHVMGGDRSMAKTEYNPHDYR